MILLSIGIAILTNRAADIVMLHRYEEHLLLGFFPDEYPQYKARTISGIPFV